MMAFLRSFHPDARRGRRGRRADSGSPPRPAPHRSSLPPDRSVRRRAPPRDERPRPPATTQAAGCPARSVTARFGIRITGAVLAARRRSGGMRLLERDARRHLRFHVLVGIQNRDSHFDDGLGTVGGRKNLAKPPFVHLILIRLQLHFRRHRRQQLRDAVLADLGLHLELAQVRDGRNRAAFAGRLARARRRAKPFRPSPHAS